MKSSPCSAHLNDDKDEMNKIHWFLIDMLSMDDRGRQGLSQDFKNACPNSNSKISAHPHLAANLLLILIATIYNI